MCSHCSWTVCSWFRWQCTIIQTKRRRTRVGQYVINRWIDGWMDELTEICIGWINEQTDRQTSNRQGTQVLFISLGFPYRDEQEISADLAKLLDPIISSEMSPLSPTDQLILMTHNGPTNSCKRESQNGMERSEYVFVISFQPLLFQLLLMRQISLNLVPPLFMNG